MSYEQLAQSVDGLHTQVTSLTQGVQDALKRTADLAKVNNSYPFTFVPGQAQYDVVVISGDPKMTTAGMGLWVEGAIEYAFTVDSLTKFSLLSIENYGTSTQMRLLGNKRFDDLVQNFDDLETALSEQYNVEKAARIADYGQYLKSLQLEPAVAYVGSLSITRATQTITQSGVLYRPLATALPITTTNWVTDVTKFAVADDMSLRQDLADPSKGAGMVAGTTVNLQALADLTTYSPRRHGDTAAIISVGAGWALNLAYPFPSGGGSFVWDASSVETPIYGMLVQVTGIVTGRWKRVYDGPVHVTMTGAIPDGLTKCSAAVQLAIDNYVSVYFPPGKFVLDKANSHSLIYTATVVDCGIKITSAQKCVELFGAGESTLLLSEPGVRYNSLISMYNVTDRSVHSFNMDGLYNRSGSAFLGGIIGIRQQSIRRCTTHSLKISNFAYHCLAMYGGSNAVTEPACLWNKAYNLYLDGGGQSSLLVYSSTFTGLVLPNEFNEFTDIYGMNSHVYFGIEVRKSNNNTFNNIIVNGNTKGGLNLEEGASYNKFTNVVGKYNLAYGLHITGNGLENVTGNRITHFDFSENGAHNVLAYQGAVGNYFTGGRFNSAVNGNGWRSEDTSSFGNYFNQVECKNNPGEGLLFQNYEYLDTVSITGNGLRGVTVFGASRHRNVVSRGNGTDITTIAGKIHDIVDCDFGPKHAIITKDCIAAGRFIEVSRAGRYANAGTTVTEETDATSISTLVWKTAVQYGALVGIPTGVFAGSKFTHLEVLLRVKTDGPSRLLRDINGTTNITIPANTDWVPVSYVVPVASLTPTSTLNIRYETNGGYVLLDGYQLVLHDGRDIQITIAPTSVATTTAVEQTFAAPGVLVGDAISVSPPSITPGVVPVCARVTATDTVAITFMNVTAGALVPASGVYRLQVTRT